MQARQFQRIFILSALCISGLAICAPFTGKRNYARVLKPAVTLHYPNDQFVYIHTGSNLKNVVKGLYGQGILKDTAGFAWLSRYIKYNSHIRPGKYRVTDGMNNMALVHLLRDGRPVKVEISLRGVRFKDDLAEMLGEQLEAEPAQVIKLLNDRKYLSANGVRQDNAMSMFVNDNFSFDWNTPAADALNRMHGKWKDVWNSSRRKKAAALHMSISSVMTLASIVQEEVLHKDEAPKIAQVYLNRLRLGMRLQADPTLKYIRLSKGNTVVKRLYDRDARLSSDYNTYRNEGLPPGPIVIPEEWAIDAVLNPEPNDYIFFVAKDDFSGYHVFSKTYDEHIVQSQRYQEELDRRNIK